MEPTREKTTEQPAGSRPGEARLDCGLLHRSSGDGLQYNLFAPLHYERNYAYPLLIWLHGPGESERQLPRIMPMISMRNYVAIAPRAVRPGPGGEGFQWTETDDDFFVAEMGIFESLEVARQRYRIASDRVFLAGYGSSGTLALRIGLKYPRRFAGIVSLCGPFPIGKVPLLYLEEARRLPLLLTSCRLSRTYPVEQTCRELRLFHAAGMHVTVRQYPADDSLTPQMLGDVDRWIMQCVTGQDVFESSCL